MSIMCCVTTETSFRTPLVHEFYFCSHYTWGGVLLSFSCFMEIIIHLQCWDYYYIVLFYFVDTCTLHSIPPVEGLWRWKVNFGSQCSLLPSCGSHAWIKVRLVSLATVMLCMVSNLGYTYFKINITMRKNNKRCGIIIIICCYMNIQTQRNTMAWFRNHEQIRVPHWTFIMQSFRGGQGLVYLLEIFICRWPTELGSPNE